MAAWISKVLSAISSAVYDHEAVRQACLRAQHQRSKITLELASSQPSVMAATIEQVADDHLAISQPTVGGHTHPLAFGEEIRLSFVDAGIQYSGQTRCLGRTKVTGEAETAETVFAYKLDLPSDWTMRPQVSAQRPEAAFAGRIEAQLYAPQASAEATPITLTEITMSGARAASLLPPPWLAPALAVFLKAKLPEPVGLIDELVEVTQIEPGVEGYAVALAFRKRIDGLADLIRAAAA